MYPIHLFWSLSFKVTVLRFFSIVWFVEQYLIIWVNQILFSYWYFSVAAITTTTMMTQTSPPCSIFLGQLQAIRTSLLFVVVPGLCFYLKAVGKDAGYKPHSGEAEFSTVPCCLSTWQLPGSLSLYLKLLFSVHLTVGFKAAIAHSHFCFSLKAED